MLPVLLRKNIQNEKWANQARTLTGCTGFEARSTLRHFPSWHRQDDVFFRSVFLFDDDRRLSLVGTRLWQQRRQNLAIREQRVPNYCNYLRTINIQNLAIREQRVPNYCNYLRTIKIQFFNMLQLWKNEMK